MLIVCQAPERSPPLASYSTLSPTQLTVIPYATDAPIYHYPIATGTIIVLCVVIFLGAASVEQNAEAQFVLPDGQTLSEEQLYSHLVEQEIESDEEIESYLQQIEPIRQDPSEEWHLQYGVIKPWQWFTSQFMHADWTHLLFNMIFLWSFGLVVEGKVGWLIFSGIYLGISVLQNMLEQLVMLGSMGSSLGASSVIFGLLAIAIVWAPQNEFSCWTGWRLYPLLDIPILGFGGLYLAKEIFFMALDGFQFGSGMLHLSGFALGLPIAFTMVYFGAVECEGYDLISVWQNRTGRQSSVEQRRVARERARSQPRPEDQAAQRTARVDLLRQQINEAVGQQAWAVALRLHSKLREIDPEVGWEPQTLGTLIQGLLAEKNYDAALPLIDWHLQHFSTRKFALVSVAAKIYLQREQPRRALRLLEGIVAEPLTEEKSQQIQKLTKIARQQIQAGAVEFE